MAEEVVVCVEVLAGGCGWPDGAGFVFFDPGVAAVGDGEVVEYGTDVALLAGEAVGEVEPGRVTCRAGGEGDFPLLAVPLDADVVVVQFQEESQ